MRVELVGFVGLRGWSWAEFPYLRGISGAISIPFIVVVSNGKAESNG